MKQAKLRARRFSARQRERSLLKKLHELIRKGDLFTAAHLSVALMRRGKPSRDAERVFRRLCLRLEVQARKVFYAGNREELRSIAKVTSQFASRRIPTALRVHRSVKDLLGKRHLPERPQFQKAKLKPAAKKPKAKG